MSAAAVEITMTTFRYLSGQGRQWLPGAEDRLRAASAALEIDSKTQPKKFCAEIKALLDKEARHA